MQIERRDTSAEAEIRALIDRRAEAVRARDVSRAMDCVSPDIVSFDVIGPLRFSGGEPARARTEQ